MCLPRFNFPSFLDESVTRKFTCRLEIGIENEKTFRVGSRVIQVARRVWQANPAFQEGGGKTRLRGSLIGKCTS